jgi:hypothetical protein
VRFAGNGAIMIVVSRSLPAAAEQFHWATFSSPSRPAIHIFVRMEVDMGTEDQIERIVSEVQSFVLDVSKDGRIPGSDFRRILRFLVKVTQVVDQVFRDVYAMLIEIKYLDKHDIDSGRLKEIQVELDLLLSRDRYREAEQVCSRLHFLGDQFQSQIVPILEKSNNLKLLKSDEWSGLFGLIEEHEGRVINLVHESVSELQHRLMGVDSNSMDSINAYAGFQAKELKQSLNKLENLQNKILGLSGEDGFLELTVINRGGIDREVNIILQSSNTNIQELKMGNQYNIGDITGSIVNMDSTLDQVTQNIGSANIDDSVKKQLADLISQLKTELQKVPASKNEDAEAITESAKALVEAGIKAQPNKTSVKITAEGLKKAAENIAGVMPMVLTIASSIVKTIFQLTGIPLP